MVAGEHQDADAGGAAARDRGGDALAQRVSDPDEPERGQLRRVGARAAGRAGDEQDAEAALRQLLRAALPRRT